MSEDTRGGTDEATEGSQESEPRTTRDRMNEGFQRGLGILSAFKEAMEETISEARERGDLSTDRAKEAIRKAADRARTATSDARERFDFVSQPEFDELARRVRVLEDKLRDRLGGEAPDEGGDA